MRTLVTAVFVAGSFVLTVPATLHAEHRAIVRAERAIESGDVDPERDLEPLLAALSRAETVDEKRELVGAISDLGAADSQSPNVVKAYLLKEATPLLLEVARTGHDPFLQGDAMAALRGMGASRAVLEQAAAIAEADPDAFVQSRGEIMRNYIASMPVEDEANARRDTDSETAMGATAYLDKRGIAVSTQALRDAAGCADADSVKALLAAGIAPDAGATTMEDTPLARALLQGCTSQGEETDWLVETVRLLVAAGADPKRRDDNANSSLIHAAHWCGPRIVTLLADAGGDVNHRNGSGTSALTMAIYGNKVEAAEALVKKGACLTAADQTAVKSFTGEPRIKALVTRAGSCKK